MRVRPTLVLPRPLTCRTFRLTSSRRCNETGPPLQAARGHRLANSGTHPALEMPATHIKPAAGLVRPGRRRTRPRTPWLLIPGEPERSTTTRPFMTLRHVPMIAAHGPRQRPGMPDRGHPVGSEGHLNPLAFSGRAKARPGALFCGSLRWRRGAVLRHRGAHGGRLPDEASVGRRNIRPEGGRGKGC